MTKKTLWSKWYKITNTSIKLINVLDNSVDLPLLSAIKLIHPDLDTFNRPINFTGVTDLDISTDLLYFKNWSHDFTTLDINQLSVHDIQLHCNHPRSFNYNGEPMSLIIHKGGVSLSTLDGLSLLKGGPRYTGDYRLDCTIESVRLRIHENYN